MAGVQEMGWWRLKMLEGCRKSDGEGFSTVFLFCFFLPDDVLRWSFTFISIVQFCILRWTVDMHDEPYHLMLE